MTTCIGRDPLCPCADGDACHYRDTPTTKGWSVPMQPEPVAVGIFKARAYLTDETVGYDRFVADMYSLGRGTHDALITILSGDVPSYLESQNKVAAPPLPAPQCKGIPRKGCNYLAACDRLCNKCGKVHHHHQMVAQFNAPQPEPLTDAQIDERIDAAVAEERERIARHFDSRDKGVGGFYDAHEPAEIIKEVDDMAEMHKPHLIERLRECLPTAADGPDHRVWCSVRGSDLREAVAELEVQREALTAAMDEVDRLRALLKLMLSLSPVHDRA
jgi:hypothetical protein